MVGFGQLSIRYLYTTFQSTNRTILFYITDSSEQITAYSCKRIHQWLITVFPKNCNEMIQPGVVVERALSGGSREGWAVFKFPALPRLAQQGGARDRLAQGVSHLPWQGLAQQLLHLSLLSLGISSLLLAPASAQSLRNKQCAKKKMRQKQGILCLAPSPKIYSSPRSWVCLSQGSALLVEDLRRHQPIPGCPALATAPLTSATARIPQAKGKLLVFKSPELKVWETGHYIHIKETSDDVTYALEIKGGQEGPCNE